MSTINEKNVDGLLEFCDFMVDKGYATPGAIDAWKSAARRVFLTVEGDGFGSTSIESLDLPDVLDRFETMTRGKYKKESIRSYSSRIERAVEAYLGYLDTGQPPRLRRVSASKKAKKAESAPRIAAASAEPTPTAQTGELIAFPFPLRGGEMATLNLPRRLQREDADRLSAFLRTLQEDTQKEIPERTGEAA
jgi:hypothetical protein